MSRQPSEWICSMPRPPPPLAVESGPGYSVEMYHSKEVLSLYRMCLRKGRQLQFTDKNYYYRRIRSEFDKNRNLSSEEEVKLNIKKAHGFLERDVLM
ncbi:hypothetical protein ScPMuIL_016191 [Solemya velum]